MKNTYESIAVLNGEDAAPALAVLDAEGPAAALAYLKRLHEPGEGTLVSTRDNPWKPDDTVHEDDQYVMYYNTGRRYIGLLLRIEI